MRVSLLLLALLLSGCGWWFRNDECERRVCRPEPPADAGPDAGDARP